MALGIPDFTRMSRNQKLGRMALARLRQDDDRI